MNRNGWLAIAIVGGVLGIGLVLGMSRTLLDQPDSITLPGGAGGIQVYVDAIPAAGTTDAGGQGGILNLSVTITWWADSTPPGHEIRLVAWEVDAFDESGHLLLDSSDSKDLTDQEQVTIYRWEDWVLPGQGPPYTVRVSASISVVDVETGMVTNGSFFKEYRL